MKGAYAKVKRLMDVIFSALLLFFLLVPMSVIGILVAVSSPGGAIFRQKRVGQDGKLFVCYKFRTMISDAPPDLPTAAFRDAEQYVTPIGRFLRRSSLDELPQLWNVLRGDMSLVGPRPLIPAERQMHELRGRSGVYRVRPGMTGLSQIRGRDALPDRDKARLDARYAHTLSLSSDCRILWETVYRVFTGKGVALPPKVAGK
ncbi:MAG: sugar transferase [Clostridia bacterium]|nr:sugar transferase [Clostridia bacterium]